MPSARGYNNVPKLARLTTQRNPVPAANHRSRSCYAGCQTLAQNTRAHRASNRVVSYEVNIPNPKPWRETFVGGHCAQMYPAWLLCSS